MQLVPLLLLHLTPWWRVGGEGGGRSGEGGEVRCYTLHFLQASHKLSQCPHHTEPMQLVPLLLLLVRPILLLAPT
jgi:hypothetical protein